MRTAPPPKKEHIANMEQMVYICSNADSAPQRLSRSRILAIRSTTMSATALRIVEGSSMDKSKDLSAALSQIGGQVGKGWVRKLGKKVRRMVIDTISAVSLGLSTAPGVGGLPRGRV